MLKKTTLIFCLCVIHWTASADPVEQAITYFDQGQFSKAEEVLQNQTSDLSPEAHYYLGMINDPEYHYIRIRSGFPKYDKVKDKKARKHYLQAIEAGHCLARYRYYIHTQSLHPLRQKINKRKAFRKTTMDCLSELAEQNDVDAIFMLGDLITIDSYEPKKKAMPYAKRLIDLAKTGNPQAQFYAGHVFTHWYLRDYSYQKNELAFAWYSVAAYQQHFRATEHAAYVHGTRIKTEAEREVAIKLAQEYIVKFAPQTVQQEQPLFTNQKD